MKYQACICDLDGVICHTDEYHFLAWKRLSDTLGLEFNRDLNNRLRGVSRRESLDIILKYNKKKLSEDDIALAMEQKNLWYREYLEQMTPRNLEPDVRPVLERLRNLGVKLAIGSSSRNALLILERLDIRGLFDACVDGTMISHSKPDPEVFLTAAALVGETPQKCVVVEDALSGFLAARAAGMDCIAYRLHSTEVDIGSMHADNFSMVLSYIE